MQSRHKFLVGILGAAMAMSSVAQAQEQKANTLFGAMKLASEQRAAAIGSYAKGCASGLVELPETGPTWQAMRLSRNRNWGHPEVIDFIQGLSQVAVQQGWAGLYVGDISQPRGGPMLSGHRSHQIGLDADIWMLPPKRVNLSRRDRENISSISIRTEDQRSVNENWTPAHREILKAAALDKRVDRVFVAAAAKIEMCKTATRRDTKWLQKIRPIYGHNTHFHVRMKCPRGSRNCITQTPTVSELSKGGNGCDATLNWWVTGYLDQLRNPPPPNPNPPPRRRHPRDYTLTDLPRQCGEVLSSR